MLAVCSETSVVQRLMDYAARLAARVNTHTSLHVLGANVTASPYPWAPYFVHGTSLFPWAPYFLHGASLSVPGHHCLFTIRHSLFMSTPLLLRMGRRCSLVLSCGRVNRWETQRH